MMRWALLTVVTGLLGFLVYVMSRPEPEPADLAPDKKESDAFFPKQIDTRQGNNQAAINFLEKCLERYRKEVKGYELIMYKEERIDDRQKPPEEIWVAFREHPFSVYFQWQKGARKAERALYVEGENGGKMLARPSGGLVRRIVGDVVSRDVDAADARQSGRYTLAQFGMAKGTGRSLATWKKLAAKNQLKVQPLGIFRLPEAGDRLCYKYHAVYAEPVDDGVSELTIWIDNERWLQVGSELKGKAVEGKQPLIGRYFFRDIKLNPKFKKDQFTRAALIPK
jgi:hypothetical protein